ncbi:TPM domain-containing protein [Yoonia sp. F2084L]|nr:TPM domain-containing protein [Yoonia sp. F2084L]
MTDTIHRLLQKTRWLILILPLFYMTAAFAQDPENAPDTQYWVTDKAEVLSSSVEKALTDNAKAFEQETTNQVVVVTVDSLAGLTIERYGRWLGNSWGIGQADQDNGVLLLVAPNDRRVRIEVGRGLEDLLSDRIAQSIIDNEILPEFRDDDLQAGIVAGHTAIIQALGGEYREPTPWEKFIHILLLPFFVIGRFLGFGGGGFSGGGGSFGGGGASGSW